MVVATGGTRSSSSSPAQLINTGSSTMLATVPTILPIMAPSLAPSDAHNKAGRRQTR